MCYIMKRTLICLPLVFGLGCGGNSGDSSAPIATSTPAPTATPSSTPAPSSSPSAAPTPGPAVDPELIGLYSGEGAILVATDGKMIGRWGSRSFFGAVTGSSYDNVTDAVHFQATGDSLEKSSGSLLSFAISDGLFKDKLTATVDHSDGTSQSVSYHNSKAVSGLSVSQLNGEFTLKTDPEISIRISNGAISNPTLVSSTCVAAGNVEFIGSSYYETEMELSGSNCSAAGSYTGYMAVNYGGNFCNDGADYWLLVASNDKTNSLVTCMTEQ